MNNLSSPLVSVCIPTYNHERYIAQCLLSVLMQVSSVDGNVEIIIGDDLSTDRTEAIIQEISSLYPNLVRYIRYEEKKGAVGNLEFLVREARGRYIAHLDGDDFWLPGKLSAQITFMELNIDCPAVYTNAFCVYDDGVPAGVFSNFSNDRIPLGFLLRHGNFLNHSSMLYRACNKEVVLPPQGSLLDFSTHLNLARRGDLGYLCASLTVYRVSSLSSMLVHDNERVRELYWAAICAVPKSAVGAFDLSFGMAEFVRSIFFRSLRLRSVDLIRRWWPRVIEQAQDGHLRLIFFVFFAIILAGFWLMSSWICRKITRNTMRVFYPR